MPAVAPEPSAIQSYTPLASRTPAPSVTPAASPTSGIKELPTLATGTYVYEVPPETGGTLSDADIRTLANLCVVEVRGYGDARDPACVSVVSTVFTRMARKHLSDGTVEGTITWDCKAGDIACQFPAYVAQGCRGIKPSACPENYPEAQTHFTIVVYEYLRLKAMTDGACTGYEYYGIKAFDYGGCRVAGEGFHQ